MIQIIGRTGLKDNWISGSNVSSEMTKGAAHREIDVTCVNNASQMNCCPSTSRQ